MDDNEFFLCINFVKNGVTSGNVKPIDDNPVSQDKFFLISLISRKDLLQGGTGKEQPLVPEHRDKPEASFLSAYQQEIERG